MKLTKITGIITCAALMLTGMAACSSGSPSSKGSDGSKSADLGSIAVISREDGSGTRGAFTELMEITDADGNDATVETAEVTNSTSVMMTTVAGNKSSIGYVSLGSLSSDVKALKVDGAEPTVENIKAGKYKVARPFNLVFNKSDLSDIASDFVSFILSKEGQTIIGKEGYISQDATESYKASGLKGTVSLAGSTSVSPVMEVIADEYKKLNPNVTVEIQQSGSSAGISSAIEKACDIGMSSRALSDEEAKKIKSTQIATDGIAVIVNKSNSVTGLTSEQIKNIFLGTTTEWNEVVK